MASSNFPNRPFSLDHIWSLNSQNVTNNTSVVRVRTYITQHNSNYNTASTDPVSSFEVWVDGVKVAGNSFGYNFNNYSQLLLSDTTRTITHNSDGSRKYTTEAYATVDIMGSTNVKSGQVTLPTIARASKPTLSPGTIDAGATMTINMNAASTAFRHDVTYRFANASGTIATGVAASTTWVVPMSLVSQIPNAITGTGTITVVTKNGSTVIGTNSVVFTMNVPSSVVPSFSSVTHSEAVPAVASNVGAYVKSLTKLNVAINGAAGSYGSTIKAFRISVAGQVVTTQAGVTGALAYSGTQTLTGTITDSRGRSVSKSVNISILNYSPPQINGISTAIRTTASGTEDSEGTTIKVNTRGTVTGLTVGGTNKNAAQYKISTRVTGTSSWSVKKTANLSSTSVNVTDLFSGYVATNSYEVMIQIIDLFKTSSYILTVGTGKIFMHWSKAGVGIGKFHQDGVLDIAGDLYQRSQLQPHGYYRTKNNTACYMRIATVDGGNADLGGELIFMAYGGNRYIQRDRPASYVAFSQRGSMAADLVETVLNPSSTFSISPTYYYKSLSDFVFEIWVQFPAHAMDYFADIKTMWRAEMNWDNDLTTTAPSGLVQARSNRLGAIATQSEVNLGTDDMRVVTAATLRNSINLPKSFYSGTTTVAATGTTSASLPLGMFSATPIILPNAVVTTNGVVGVAWIGALPSTLSFSLRIYSLTGAQVGGTVQWVAIQQS